MLVLLLNLVLEAPLFVFMDQTHANRSIERSDLESFRLAENIAWSLSLSLHWDTV